MVRQDTGTLLSMIKAKIEQVHHRVRTLQVEESAQIAYLDIDDEKQTT